MTLVDGVYTTLAVFALVALRVLQQQNVVHSYYWWAVITSYGIAFAEIALILYVVKEGFAAVWWVGTGGALGATFAMFFHKRFIRRDCSQFIV